MADKTFTLMASTTASTERRANADANEFFQAPVENIASLACTPVDALDPEIAIHAGLIGAPFTAFQVFVQSGLDIIAGDVLVVGSQDYYIRSIEPYEWTPDSAAVYMRLVLEKTESNSGLGPG